MGEAQERRAREGAEAQRKRAVPRGGMGGGRAATAACFLALAGISRMGMYTCREGCISARFSDELLE